MKYFVSISELFTLFAKIRCRDLYKTIVELHEQNHSLELKLLDIEYQNKLLKRENEYLHNDLIDKQ